MEPQEYLEHHGVMGMHWGIRRYQNEDGTLTERGQKRLDQNKKKLDRLQEEAGVRQRLYSKAATRYQTKMRKKRIVEDEYRVEKEQNKLDKTESKYAAALERATRYYNKLEKRYKDTTVETLSQQQISRGKDYANRLLTMNDNTVSRVYDDRRFKRIKEGW